MHYTINHIAFNTNNQKIFFKIQISKKLINLLKIFKKHAIISSYFLTLNNKKRLFAIISPCYNKRLKINFYFKSFILANYRMQITLKALNILKKRTGNSTYILSTSLGLIDHHEALSLKKTGFFLGMIHS